MKTPFRTTRSRKRVLLPAGLVAGALVLGGGTLAFGALDDGDELTGDRLDRASAAALRDVGDGKVVGAEMSDDEGVAYELEVRRSNGDEVDVDLDKSYTVVHTDTDRDDDDDGRDDDDDDGRDADDRRLSDAEWTSIEKAATDEVGGGTLTDAEASEDRGVAYEAEVRRGNGTEFDVRLDSDFGIVDSQEDGTD